jgi:ABC-type dipeptide/oligopeptide/nickel transport system ATPase component
VSGPTPLLAVEDLRTSFTSRAGTVRAVDGVSFALKPGGSLGVVGESGSGKSVASLSIMRLVEAPGRITGGRCWRR